MRRNPNKWHHLHLLSQRRLSLLSLKKKPLLPRLLNLNLRSLNLNLKRNHLPL